VTSRHPDAVKSFDEALFLWCESRPGKAIELLNSTLKLDPSFTMAHVLRALLCQANALEDAAKSVTAETSWREKKHVEAVTLFSQRKFSDAVRTWDDILVRHPTDLFALRFGQDLHYYLGESFQLRDSVGCTYQVDSNWLEMKKKKMKMNGEK
jgi:hypothetical protein